MKGNIVIGDVVWEVVSCYCPQAGRSVNKGGVLWNNGQNCDKREGVGEWWL